MHRSWLATIALAACVPASSGNPTQLAVPKPEDPIDPMDPFPDDPNTPCEERGPPVTPRLRRLTFAQYDRTVSDLVGLEVRPSSELGPEVDGITSVLWAGIETAAADVSQQVVGDSQALTSLLSCAARDDACAA